MNRLGDTGVGGSEDDESAVPDAVVRVFCTHSQPNFGIPWQRTKQDYSTSSGFVIQGRRILTNAHAIEYGTLVQVKKRQSERKYVATVAAVGHECDLAVLSVADESFWDDLSPLSFGAMPDLLDEVQVIGYPVGGESISISSGVVSRIEMQRYAQASAELLAIQIDAAINPGNSGGPVVNGADQVIGVAFQSLSSEDTENIGYVVPSNVVSHFLDNVERHGSYLGVCGLGCKLQGTENESLRRYYNLSDDQNGVLVLETDPLAPSSSVLRRGDVILNVDDIKVASDGTIPFREGSYRERVFMNYYFTQRFPSDSVRLRLMRQGEVVDVQCPLYIPQPLVPRLILKSPLGAAPSYFVTGGLVFVALNREYLGAEFNLDHVHGEFEGWASDLELLALTVKQSSGKDGRTDGWFNFCFGRFYALL
jgi:S1-C subfamily serine protease